MAAYTAMTSSPFNSSTVMLADTYLPLELGRVVTFSTLRPPSAPSTSPTTSSTKASPPCPMAWNFRSLGYVFTFSSSSFHVRLLPNPPPPPPPSPPPLPAAPPATPTAPPRPGKSPPSTDTPEGGGALRAGGGLASMPLPKPARLKSGLGLAVLRLASMTGVPGVSLAGVAGVAASPPPLPLPLSSPVPSVPLLSPSPLPGGIHRAAAT
mmetsp:Transcript_7676/g.19547  ORF Transcript_7676/g.19547 Transcript_7676/m.19547 type:complete len:209 (+) Transcript_7676:650-1276(+)